MSSYEAILFDLDGTLIDSKRAIVKSFLEAAKEVGIEIDPKIVEENLGLSSREVLKKAPFTSSVALCIKLYLSIHATEGSSRFIILQAHLTAPERFL